MIQKVTNKRNTVVLIAPLGEPSKRVRLAKTIRLIGEDYNCDIAFWGWRRTAGEDLGKNMDGIIETRLLIKGGGFRNIFARLFYIAYIFSVFVTVLRHAPRRVYCLGLETALPVWFASLFRPRIRYVFDDPDRLILLWPLPKLVERMLIYLETKVSMASVAHILPTKKRYDYNNKKQVEISNMPDLRQVSEALKKAPIREKGKLLVYVNGWLDISRGLNLLDCVAETLDLEGNSDIVFNVAAGRITGDASRFLKRSCVRYLGSLSQIDSLAQYPVNDVVVTFYDPSVRINRYALPNKWGDAMAMGTPVICNTGILTAEPLLASGAAFGVSFENADDLVNLLKDLSLNYNRLEEAKISITVLGRQQTYFEKSMTPVLSAFLGVLEP